MTKLTRVELEAHQQREMAKFWREAAEARGLSLAAFYGVLIGIGRQESYEFERWYNRNIRTGKSACLEITEGEWP